MNQVSYAPRPLQTLNMLPSVRPKRKSRGGDSYGDSERAGAGMREKENSAPGGKKRREDDPPAVTTKKTTKKRRNAEMNNDDGFEFRVRKSKRISERNSLGGSGVPATSQSTQTTTITATSNSVKDPPVPVEARPKKRPITPPKERPTKKAVKASTKEPRREARKVSPERGGEVNGAKISRLPVPQNLDDSRGSIDASKIKLPVSDTPINRKNQKFRQDAQGGQRRSSLGLRGRRASSLMIEGIVAEPHSEIPHEDFYKHIQGEQPEVVRMRQLLSWCGHRALTSHDGTTPESGSANAVARVIEEEILKEITSNGEVSSWYLRDNAPASTVPKKPNPRNINNIAKLEELKGDLQKLQDEQDGWVSLLSSNLQESLSLSGGGVDNKSFDTSFLRPEESEFAKSLESSQDVIGTARRIVKQQGADIEFQMDQLADGVHKLRQYGETADRLAGRILEGANCTLAEREARLRQASGTEALPIQEVLRSLSRVDR